MTVRRAALLLLLLEPVSWVGSGTDRQLPVFPPLPSPRPRVRLATFAGCTSAGRLPVFVAEARRSGFFDDVHAALPATLDASWLARHGGRLRPSLRGCGYWSWKPQVVRETLALMADGEVLVYADAGSSLHPENCGRFWQYVALAAAHPDKVLSFEMARGRSPAEHSWSKADAGAALGLLPGSPHWASPQLHATYFFLVNCPSSRDLVAAWAEAATAQEYHLVDDSPGATPEPPGFVEHRHDQSLFSLLRKQRGAALLLPDDAAAGGGPIQSTRCRTGGERACTLRRLKEALWAVARDRVPRLEAVADAQARRSCPRAQGRLHVAPPAMRVQSAHGNINPVDGRPGEAGSNTSASDS
jgi:hypothetical protein